MTRDARRNQERVLRTVQELLRDEEDKSAISPDLISSKIDMVLTMNPKWREGLDRTSITDELIRRFSLWIGQDTILIDNTGHEAWLTAARKKGWRYWQRYQDLLEARISTRAVEALDTSTDTVLGMLEDPAKGGQWDRRGLVVGHVQSGKTANYTGLICKAADAGYKVIIVLAGIHNNLRSQTQMRLDEGFLGYETHPNREDLKPIGVGLIDTDPAIRPNFVTNRSEKGDFSTAIVRNLGITPEQRPWLFVVKKNKTVLERLNQWIRNHVADSRDPSTGRRIVTNLPLLLIDDEADHASVDTGEQAFDADGNPDEEHSPTAINSRIRRLLFSFARSAYVGYTATPFANIFIHEQGSTREEGPDLFPASFILNLAAPSSYVGPARVFGTPSPDGRVGGLPLIRPITDHASVDGLDGWMPPKHKNGHGPLFNGIDTVPPSLIEAIDAFLLSCSVRVLRGDGGSHASMLIHVTRFNHVQTEVYRQVEDLIRKTRQRIHRGIECDTILARMKSLWERDFIPTMSAVSSTIPDEDIKEPPAWEAILSVLPEVLADVNVRTINGTAKDALDYADSGEIGLKVIAIGGDKLSRGLTLEGLCVSYFLRASRMYDTLMQMGRWFGYRTGYLDLCRLYTTPDLVEWFGHIADASEQLREEFDLMAASHGDPKAYGLKVQSHPTMMVTSRLKMRAARDLWLSFSGDVSETVVFFRDPATLQQNLRALQSLLETMGRPQKVNPLVTRNGLNKEWRGYVWEQVDSGHVTDFLSAYRTHPESHKVISYLLAEFIHSMNGTGELTSWTVALIGAGSGRAEQLAPGIDVNLQKRQDKGYPGRYSIGRLLDPPDEAIDLDEKAWAAALEDTLRAFHADPGRMSGPPIKEAPSAPSGPAIRKVRGKGAAGIAPHPERGLLLLYALDPEKANADLPEGTPPIIGFGISFPASNSGAKVRYAVNNVMLRQWEREYGASD